MQVVQAHLLLLLLLLPRPQQRPCPLCAAWQVAGSAVQNSHLLLLLLLLLPVLLLLLGLLQVQHHSPNG
jgi:hypothetical protein